MGMGINFEILDNFFSDYIITKSIFWDNFEENYSRRLNNFFSPLIINHRVSREYKREIEKHLATDFNFIGIISPDENKISDILKLLLDPEGAHGQGNIFFKLFIENVKSEIGSQPQYLDQNIEKLKINISREAYFSGRKIDILITLNGNFAIGIENKPWAYEQESQIEDYIGYLKQIYKENFIFIFLHGTGQDPYSIDPRVREELIRRRKYFTASYRGFMVRWLESCHKNCEAEKVRFFLKDFIAWINMNFREESYE